MSIVYDSHDSRFTLRTPAREAGLLHLVESTPKGKRLHGQRRQRAELLIATFWIQRERRPKG